MSYHQPPRHLRHRALGDLTSLLTSAGKGLDAATNILQDPYFNEVAGLVVQLHKLEQPSTSTPGASSKPGIGLDKVVGPLRTYVKVRQNPWMLYAGLFALFAIPYALGRASRRSK